MMMSITISHHIGERLKLEGETETDNMGVCTKERKHMKDVWGAGFAGSLPPFLGRERAAVDVDVGPERRRPRYHEPNGIWQHDVINHKSAT